MGMNKCPHCGYAANIAPIDPTEGALQLTGSRLDGVPILVCLRCDNGMLVGPFGNRAIPKQSWDDLRGHLFVIQGELSGSYLTVIS